jgi:hypothetical protein
MPLIFTTPTKPTPPPRTPWKDVKKGDTFKADDGSLLLKLDTNKCAVAVHIGPDISGTTVVSASIYADEFRRDGVVLVNVQCVTQDV